MTIILQDNEHIKLIVESLPLQSYRKYKSLSLQTEPSREINIVYEFDDSYTQGGNGLDPFPGIVEQNNVLLLFATVQGLEKVNFLHYDKEELNYTAEYTVDDLNPRFGNIKPLGMGFSDLYKSLASNILLSEFYFAYYSGIYLGAEPEDVSYRNMEPHEIKEQPDGSLYGYIPTLGKSIQFHRKVL